MKLPKFLAVGLLGTITNLTLFYIFVDIMMFPALQISIITFLIASLQNYILNDPAIKVVAQAFGIAGGTMINFLGSKYWVFK